MDPERLVVSAVGDEMGTLPDKLHDPVDDEDRAEHLRSDKQ